MKKQALWAAAALLAVSTQVYLLEDRGEPVAPVAEAAPPPEPAPIPDSKAYQIRYLAFTVKPRRGSTQPPRQVPMVRRLQEGLDPKTLPPPPARLETPGEAGTGGAGTGQARPDGAEKERFAREIPAQLQQQDPDHQYPLLFAGTAPQRADGYCVVKGGPAPGNRLSIRVTDNIRVESGPGGLQLQRQGTVQSVVTTGTGPVGSSGYTSNIGWGPLGSQTVQPGWLYAGSTYSGPDGQEIVYAYSLVPKAQRP